MGRSCEMERGVVSMETPIARCKAGMLTTSNGRTYMYIHTHTHGSD